MAYSRLRVWLFGRIQDYILDYRFVGFITTKETKIRKWILQCDSNSEFTQQDGKTLLCDKRDRVITCEFCRDLDLTLMSSGLYKKIRLKESEVWRKVILKKLLSRLAHKVCRLRSSPVLLRKFTNTSAKRRQLGGHQNQQIQNKVTNIWIRKIAFLYLKNSSTRKPVAQITFWILAHPRRSWGIPGVPLRHRGWSGCKYDWIEGIYSEFAFPF